MSGGTSDPLEQVVRYHERTKHHLDRYARSAGYMDWANQPDPFRRYEGAAVRRLELPEETARPSFDELFAEGGSAIASEPVTAAAVSRLFFYSLALSAWKQAPGTDPWSLRVNPSSGDLHPTEAYLVAGPVEGLSGTAALYHYAPFEHVLEERRAIAAPAWEAVSRQLPPGAMLVALTSIYWREAWKYGERGFRYCQHDAGHAICAIAVAAAALGWRSRLIETVGDAELAVLLGVDGQTGPEAEHADCLLAVYPRRTADSATPVGLDVGRGLLERLAAGALQGAPNRLSREHQPWPVIEEAAAATASPGRSPGGPASRGGAPPFARGVPRPVVQCALPDRMISAHRIIRQRRSAVEMDGRTWIDGPVFLHMLARALPGGLSRAGAAMPWRPRVSLALFVHRVRDVKPGLYLLVRHPDHEAGLRQALHSDFAWSVPKGCPAALGLFLLREADCRRAARVVSCHQEIASDGVFSCGMLAELEAALEDEGPWFYRRLFWETGLIGQILYLEAEAAGIGSTGIGCFFDDAMHSILGITGRAWQSLYHFTVGGPVADTRLKTLPAYKHRS